MEKEINRFIVNPEWATKYCNYDDKICLVAAIYENFPENYGIVDIDLGKKINKVVDDFFTNNKHYLYLSHYMTEAWEKYDDNRTIVRYGLTIPTGIKVVYVVLAVKFKNNDRN